ncbi:hypothetical protein [Mycobacterium sp. NPDC006124]|uniref:hypothetical protein n=1 Tax=Mycobacterium sp. NPDC006124 TaxID=3156729 RepID=UPI0033A1C7F1
MIASEYGSLEPVTCRTHGIVGAAAAVVTEDCEFDTAATGSVTGAATSAAVLLSDADGAAAGAGTEVPDAAAAGDDPELTRAETVECSPLDPASSDPTEPRFVWALTVVLSSADTVVVEADVDEGEDSDVVVGVDDDPADAVSPDAGVEVCCAGAEEPADSCGPASPAGELALDDEDAGDDDDPESSARALAASGAASEAPNSAAPMPAEAAPTRNHRRTPKSSDRCPPRRFRSSAMI